MARVCRHCRINSYTRRREWQRGVRRRAPGCAPKVHAEVCESHTVTRNGGAPRGGEKWRKGRHLVLYKLVGFCADGRNAWSVFAHLAPVPKLDFFDFFKKKNSNLVADYLQFLLPQCAIFAPQPKPDPKWIYSAESAKSCHPRRDNSSL